MFEAHMLFPTAVGRIKYENHAVIKKKILRFIEMHPEMEVDGIISPQLKHFFNSSQLEGKFFDYVDDQDFKNFLLESAFGFSKHVMGLEIDEITMTDCWLNKCYSGGHQIFHNHANSFVSATYYVNYDASMHSPLKFLNPLLQNNTVPFLELNVENNTEFNHNESICSFLEEGDLILWMSHLSHGYDINNGNDRISLSMNFMPSTLKSGPYKFKIEQ